MCSHRTTHVDAKLDVLDEMDRLMALLKDPLANPAYARLYQKLTDEERAELAYERSIKHQPQWRKHPYD